MKWKGWGSDHGLMWSASPCLSGGTEENNEDLRIVIWDLLLKNDYCETVGLSLQYSMLVLELQTLCLLGLRSRLSNSESKDSIQ